MNNQITIKQPSKIKVDKIKKLSISNLVSLIIKEHINNVSNIIYNILELTEEQKENTNNILKNKTHNLMISKNLKSKYILLNPIYKKGIKHTKITENDDDATDDEATDDTTDDKNIT